MINTQFQALSKQEQWPGEIDINLTYVIGHVGFPNLYVFGIGPLGMIQIGIHQVSHKHALNIIGSHWFFGALPVWLRKRLTGPQGFHFNYIGRFPTTYAYSKSSYHAIHVGGHCSTLMKGS